MPKAKGTTLSGRDWMEAIGFCLLIAVVILAILGGIAIYIEVK
jgi:hypothetical protein